MLKTVTGFLWHSMYTWAEEITRATSTTSKFVSLPTKITGFCPNSAPDKAVETTSVSASAPACFTRIPVMSILVRKDRITFILLLP